MRATNRFPTDLARAVHSELKSRKSTRPPLRVLVSLFESMYFASLRTEESESIVFHLVYLNPKRPDPKPPEDPTRDRWTCVSLAQPLPVTIPNLVKIAKASDPRTSSLAIYHDAAKRLFVWGLVDQGNSFHNFINFESDSAYMRPGAFQASIAGTGHLVAYIGSEKIAELKTNTIVRSTSNVLWGGPIRNALDLGLSAYISAVKRGLPDGLQEEVFAWDLDHYWIASLCRLLLRIQNYRHGGAVLMTPDASLQGLNVKYQIRSLANCARSPCSPADQERLCFGHNFRELRRGVDG